MDLSTYKIKTSTKNFKAEWEVTADELTQYFGRNCYWIFWRYPKHKIYEKFKEIQKLSKEKQNFKYFLGMIKK